MNWLFLAFVVCVGGGAMLTRRRLQPSAGATQQGEIPGYSSTEGRVFALDPVAHLDRGVDWWPDVVEEFHSSDRARIVLRFGLRARVEAADVRELLRASAQQVAQRTNAHVVYAEGLTDGELRGAYMFAPDGRGWSGLDAATEAWFAGGPT